MKFKDCPAVILGAGEGRRFLNRKRHKSLLNIKQDSRIIDHILSNLERNGVRLVLILHGDNDDGLTEYIYELKHHIIQKEFKDLDISLLQAREDCIKGPLYTLLTLHSAQNSVKVANEVRENFLILPSDTVFHPIIYERILNEHMNNNESCLVHLFVLEVAGNELQLFNKKYKFTARKYPSKDFIIKQKSNMILAPIVVVCDEFLKYANSRLGEGLNTVFDVIKVLEAKSDSIVIHKIPYNDSIPPFLDIDTKEKHNILMKIRDHYI